MLYPRIIPCLLVHDKGLVKTVQFSHPKYVGDPINAVRIFNEKEVDELMVLDIDASIKRQEPDYEMIAKLAIECRMPFCYGGGIKTIDQAQRIFSLGVEKIAISSAALQKSELIEMLAKRVGSQSVIVVLDIKYNHQKKEYEIWTRNARENTRKNPVEFSKKCENLGAGEIVLNSIDNDGTMNGYDKLIIEKIRKTINIPLTVLGGAGKLDHIGEIIRIHGIIGVAAGSLFVFKGRYKAVLINYPDRAEKNHLITSNLS